MAPALALKSLVQIIDLANQILGPLPGLEETIRTALGREFPDATV